VAVLQIPDAIPWSLPAPFATAGPSVPAGLMRTAGLALPAMAAAAPFGALAIRRFLAAVCAVTGFTLAPAASAATALVPPTQLGSRAGFAAIAAVALATALGPRARSSAPGLRSNAPRLRSDAPLSQRHDP